MNLMNLVNLVILRTALQRRNEHREVPYSFREKAEIKKYSTKKILKRGAVIIIALVLLIIIICQISKPVNGMILQCGNYSITLWEDKEFSCDRCSTYLKKDLENNYVFLEDMEKTRKSITEFFHGTKDECVAQFEISRKS